MKLFQRIFVFLFFLFGLYFILMLLSDYTTGQFQAFIKVLMWVIEFTVQHLLNLMAWIVRFFTGLFGF